MAVENTFNDCYVEEAGDLPDAVFMRHRINGLQP